MEAFYRAEKVTDAITAIYSRTYEIMYLIEGHDQALLLDTSAGAGNLKAFVQSLTAKPVTVVLTHGHIDHAMGAAEFGTAYLNHLDREVYDSMSGFEARRGYIAGNLGGNFPEELAETFVPPYPVHFLDLHDGDTFDLGGLHVIMYECPGHTRGCMAALVREEQVLVLGDAGSNATFLFDDNALTVEEYRGSLQKLKTKVDGKFQRIFIMHHVMELQPELIDQLIAVCDDIMNGNTYDKEFKFHGGIYYIAKKADHEFKRTDGMDGNIIYNKSKIFIK